MIFMQRSYSKRSKSPLGVNVHLGKLCTLTAQALHLLGLLRDARSFPRLLELLWHLALGEENRKSPQVSRQLLPVYIQVCYDI